MDGLLTTRSYWHQNFSVLIQNTNNSNLSTFWAYTSAFSACIGTWVDLHILYNKTIEKLRMKQSLIFWCRSPLVHAASASSPWPACSHLSAKVTARRRRATPGCFMHDVNSFVSTIFFTTKSPPFSYCPFSSHSSSSLDSLSSLK